MPLEKTISKSSQANIQEIAIDTSLPLDLRSSLYIQQIENPYCFLCGDTPVQLVFADHQPELSTLLTHYLASLK